MSALATQLPAVADVPVTRPKKGPTGECVVYGPGDKEDWLAVNALRQPPRDWATARRVVHAQLGIAGGVPDGNKFRYHWRGKCGCWTENLKDWIESQS